MADATGQLDSLRLHSSSELRNFCSNAAQMGTQGPHPWRVLNFPWLRCCWSERCPAPCGGLASCRLQLRRSCPEAPEKTAHLRLRQGHMHLPHKGSKMRRFFGRFWAGAPQLQPAACEAAASCRAALAPEEQEPREIEHAPRVRPLGAHLGRVATKTPQLSGAVEPEAEQVLVAPAIVGH